MKAAENSTDVRHGCLSTGEDPEHYSEMMVTAVDDSCHDGTGRNILYIK